MGFKILYSMIHDSFEQIFKPLKFVNFNKLKTYSKQHAFITWNSTFLAPKTQDHLTFGQQNFT